jgi:hypothetical protein
MNSIADARAKLQAPQAFYDYCDDLEHCPKIGWNNQGDGNPKPDVVGDLINAAYKVLKSNNYDYKVLKLYIWSSTKFCSSFDQNEYGLSEIKFVTFAGENRAPLCLPVQLFRTYYDSIEIRLKLGGEWVTFRTFLDVLVLAAPVDPAKTNHIWEKSGQSFRFLALPRELRDLVYYYSTFENEPALVTPYRYSSRGAKIEGVRQYQGSFHNVSLMAPQMHPQVREESKKMLYTTAAFNFRSTLAFSNFQFSLRSDTWNMIRNLELEFGYEAWLRVLGASLSTAVRWNPCHSLDGLKTLNLKKLKISFRTPSDLEIGKSRLFYDKNGCHTKTVQWILDLLVPILAELDVKELRLEGYIKNVQKSRFFDRFQKYKNSLEVTDVKPEDLIEEINESGGVSLGSYRAKAILAVMDDYTEEHETPDMMFDPEEIYHTTQL